MQAEALAAALNGTCLTATVLKKNGHRFHPCVLVTGGAQRHGVAWVYAVPDYGQDDRQWWFWSSSLEPIAPISEVSETADEIAGAFTRACGTLSGEAAPA
jgi:hypothetical protein